MTSLITFRSVFLAFLMILSCKQKEMPLVISNCNDSVNYQAHTKHTIYQSILEKYKQKGLPGINVLIEKKGELVWAGSVGVSSLEKKEPVKLCNLFQTGSVGKMYCGVAIMQLVEEGKLKLDQTIDQYLPAHLLEKVPNAKSATIANLLSHTSGIPDYADNMDLMLSVFNDKNVDFSREAILEKYVYKKTPKAAPGKEYSYSNSNYEILTIIIDHVTGSTHANRYTNNIFKPLGLLNTYYKNETNYIDLHKKNMVNGYFDRHSDGKLENATDMSLMITKGQTGSDGIVSDIYDVFRFMKGIFEAKIVTPQTLTLMKEYIKAKHNFKTYKYGLGLTFRNADKNFSLATSIGHSGSLPGYAAESWFFPDQETYIIFTSNVGNILDGPFTELLEEFRKELYEKVLK